MQLQFVLLGLAISLVGGTACNRILLLFGIYDLVWFGPNFALILVIAVAYAVVKHHLLNIKVILTEILTFFILLVLLPRFFFQKRLKS